MSKQDRDAYLCKKYGCDKPVDSLKGALLAKDMVPWEILYLASVGVDAGATQSCISANECRERNPLLGNNTAQRYTVGTAAVVTALLSAGYLREHDHGTLAKALLWVPTVVHVNLAVESLRDYRGHWKCSGNACVYVR